MFENSFENDEILFLKKATQRKRDIQGLAYWIFSKEVLAWIHLC